MRPWSPQSCSASRWPGSSPAPAPSRRARLVVGFQDDPSFRWDANRLALLDEARDRERARRAHAGRLVERRADPAGARRQSVRPGVQARRRRRPRPPGAAARHGRADHDLGHAGLGERQAPARTACPPGSPTSPPSPRRSRRATRAATPGYPAVRYWTVWNEPNLQQFLAPQFTPSGGDAAPALYAKLYRAAYRGIKAGYPAALVGIGETSPWGRDHLGRRHVAADPLARRASPSSSPQADPKLPFDAWAHHPYPTSLGLPPEQKSRWPNVVADVAAALLDGARRLVPPHVDADLDHRVRLPDAAARSVRRDRRPAGDLRRRARCRWQPPTPTCRCSSGSSCATRRRHRGAAACSTSPAGASPPSRASRQSLPSLDAANPDDRDDRRRHPGQGADRGVRAHRARRDGRPGGRHLARLGRQQARRGQPGRAARRRRRARRRARDVRPGRQG